MIDADATNLMRESTVPFVMSDSYMASCMSHSPSFRRNGGSSLGAEFHEGLAMSLMSMSSVVVLVAGRLLRGAE